MLLAAVKRLYVPGCKFDQMMVLIGPQGAGKSSLLAKP
jgi:predicted P-loop ATPase